MLAVLASRRFFRAEPAESFWFHPNTGDPLLWFARPQLGQIEFYSRPGRHPLTGALLQPVTAMVREEWLARRRGEADLAEADAKPSPLR